jgi:hypothetical protein
MPALEGADVRLRGGAAGYVFDRKAADLVYQLRLHVVGCSCSAPVVPAGPLLVLA